MGPSQAPGTLSDDGSLDSVSRKEQKKMMKKLKREQQKFSSAPEDHSADDALAAIEAPMSGSLSTKKSKKNKARIEPSEELFGEAEAAANGVETHMNGTKKSKKNKARIQPSEEVFVEPEVAANSWEWAMNVGVAKKAKKDKARIEPSEELSVEPEVAAEEAIDVSLTKKDKKKKKKKNKHATDADVTSAAMLGTRSDGHTNCGVDGADDDAGGDQIVKEKKMKKRKAEEIVQEADILSVQDQGETVKDKKKKKKQKKDKTANGVPDSPHADGDDAAATVTAAVDTTAADRKTKNCGSGATAAHGPQSMDAQDAERARAELGITVMDGGACPPPVTSFAGASFADDILKALETMGFSKPTPIQAQGLPIGLSGADLIGLAATGSGKTLAFLLPALMHVRAAPPLRPKDGPLVLVLAPTRELAVQIQSVAEKFSKLSGGCIRSTCVYGGVPKHPQVDALRAGCEIVVATPGRLIDLLDCRATNLSRVSMLVLDEADRMLDMGFQPQIRSIMTRLSPSTPRQTLMFSATWPADVQDLAREFLRPDRVHIVVGSVELAANHQVTQIVEVVQEFEKRRRLTHWLQKWKNEGRILIFALYKKSADRLCQNLQADGWPVQAMHGDKSQNERDRALETFRNGKTPILVATDVAARGLDVKDIRYVFNYEMPLQIEDYVHRIGRTGRAGASGLAVTLFTAENAKSPGHAGGLVNILREGNQEITPELEQLALRAPGRKIKPKKEEDTFKAFGVKASHVKFD